MQHKEAKNAKKCVLGKSNISNLTACLCSTTTGNSFSTPPYLQVALAGRNDTRLLKRCTVPAVHSVNPDCQQIILTCLNDSSVNRSVCEQPILKQNHL
jgi:hypothetical protein